MKSVDAIFCADNHFRDDIPVCRVDDFLTAQRTKLQILKGIAYKHNAPTLCAGDLLDYWKISHELETYLIRHLPRPWITVAGQHELPNHRLDQLDRSALQVLQEGRAIIIPGDAGWRHETENVTVYGCSWGQISFEIKTKSNTRNILLWHRMVWNKKPPFPGADPEGEALSLLKRLPQFDVIVTGDNHQTFEVEYKGRWLINPGPMTRQRAVEADLKPGYYLWCAVDNTWERREWPITPDAVSISHLLRQKTREGLSAFTTELLKLQGVSSLDFESNLKLYLKKHRPSKPVEDLIWQLIQTPR